MIRLDRVAARNCLTAAPRGWLGKDVMRGLPKTTTPKTKSKTNSNSYGHGHGHG